LRNQNIFKKTLDKGLRLWYNLIVKRKKEVIKMYDWFDKVMIAICVILVLALVGILVLAIIVGIEPSGEEFDTVGWVANPANPASPLYPRF
jgi:hypothetical protein